MMEFFEENYNSENNLPPLITYGEQLLYENLMESVRFMEIMAKRISELTEGQTILQGQIDTLFRMAQ